MHARNTSQWFSHTNFARSHSAAGQQMQLGDAARSPHTASASVLVVGVIPSLIWPVVRSLALSGHRPVVLGWQLTTPLHVVPECRYVPWRGVQWVDGKLSPTLLIQVDAECAARGINRVLAADYPTTLLLSEYGHRLKVAAPCAVPDVELIRALHNKWHFSQLLTEHGIPQPMTALVENAEQLACVGIPFPLITKPVDRWGSIGFQIHKTRAELLSRLRSAKLAAPFPLLVQSFAPGHDVGFAFLARHGEIVADAAFEHRVRGRRRCFDAPAIRAAVVDLVRQVGYHGIGEIDVRYDPRTGDFRLLEVNPRFWASLLYVTRAGVNFPDLLLRLGELGGGSRARADEAPVRLSPYEFTVSRGVLAGQNLHYRLVRWAGG